MGIAVIVSTKDKAGMNIKDNLSTLGFAETKDKFENHPVLSFSTAKLYTTESNSVECENIDSRIDADLFIFATKHRSESGVNSLCVHSPGNWSKAELGGADRKLCIAPADYLKSALLKLMELNTLGFDIIQECTHHGPYLGKPCMFIEIGSNEEAWQNKLAGEIIAKTIIHLIENPPQKFKPVFGIGGLHHTPNLTKIMLKTDMALGHVCPKYNLPNLTGDLVSQAIERTLPTAALVILDWKGLGTEKERLVKMLQDMRVNFRRTKDFRE